jgi:hypothetical protein
MQEHAGTGSVVEDQREILERLDAVSRLPLRPEERARIAGQLTQARSGVEAARISRRALALAQRDSDPADRMGSGLSRGGYVRIGRR